MSNHQTHNESIDGIEPLLAVKDVKTILNVSTSSVYNMVARGQLPAVAWEAPGNGKRLSQVIRFKRQDIFDFIESNYRR
jgi:hypothetical protein